MNKKLLKRLEIFRKFYKTMIKNQNFLGIARKQVETSLEDKEDSKRKTGILNAQKSLAQSTEE